MGELRQIVDLWHSGNALVLATVIHVEGSSYRRRGARLLLADAASYAGTISGGCLEAEVMRKALWKVRDGAVVERYSTLFDDTTDIPYGLGCGGVVDLLLEPVDTPEGQAMLHALERSMAGEQATVVTWLPGEGKTLGRVIFASDGEVIFASEGLEEKKIVCAHTLLPGEVYEGQFVERLLLPQRLFVIGAGDDAKPLVTMATLMGWNVTVVDGRAQLAKADRFSSANRVVCMEDCEILGIRPDDAVVVMTHSYQQDRAFLSGLLPFAPRYLGLLGARHRSSLLISEVAAVTGLSVAACCERIWTPVGLNLGGDGPEAIALSIVAEVQAVCMGKLGTSQRLTPGDVAQHIREGSNLQYLEKQCAADLAR